MFVKRVIIFFVAFSAQCAMGADEPNSRSICERALFATGLEWKGSHDASSPLNSIHPAYSTTAESIYFFYEIDGLTIHLEHGPYKGMAGTPELKRLYLKYDPKMFFPGSFFRRMFGKKSLVVTEADIGNHYMGSLFTNDEASEILELQIPLTELAKRTNFYEDTALLILSRPTGKVLGYGPRGQNIFSEVTRGIWMEMRENSNAQTHGRGFWYNSDSGMPAPRFCSTEDILRARQCARENQ